MAKVFLDVNIIIDLLEKRRGAVIDDLIPHTLFASPLSLHIIHYVTKQKVPYDKLLQVMEQFSIVPLDEGMTQNSLVGPTTDFEDNVQLHSAAEADCDLFLTRDKAPLALTFFGKTEIVSGMQMKRE